MPQLHMDAAQGSAMPSIWQFTRFQVSLFARWWKIPRFPMGKFCTQNSCTYEGSALDGPSLFMVSVAAKQRRTGDKSIIFLNAFPGLGLGRGEGSPPGVFVI